MPEYRLKIGHEQIFSRPFGFKASHWSSDRSQMLLTDLTEVSPTPSPEDGNISSCQNVVLYRAPDDGRSPEKYSQTFSLFK
jgi:hypothetical protein